jgi:hypothetical protein
LWHNAAQIFWRFFMKKIVHTSIRLDSDLYNRLPEKGKNAFINEAIRNQLDNSHNAGKEFNSMKRKINSIDVDSLHQALADLLSTAHVIFSEQMIHRELLKVIHRRVTVAASLDRLILENLTDKATSGKSFLSSKALVKSEQQQLNIYVEEEIPAK